MHAHDPNFHVKCGVNGCLRTYQNYRSFRKHLKRCHSGVDITGSLCEDDPEDPEEMETPEMDVTTASNDHWSSDHLRSNALLLLKAREIHKIPQNAVDDLTSDFAEMCTRELETLQKRLTSCLRNNGIDPKGINGFTKIFSESKLCNIFQGLNSRHLQDKYFMECLNLVVRFTFLCVL